jgi:hypothetical protein
MAETHTNCHRYYPATQKDHERDMVKHEYREEENEGMDTHTSTSRYVPAKNDGKFFQWIHNKDNREGINIKSNWFGVQL